ncbi:MAG: CBS domain-containing protein [Thermoguttaceae bacterium]|jgi:CBS domain-containing protein
MLTAKDLMEPNVIAISPETPVARAIDMLIEYGVSGLPIVDSDRQILGVITEFALLSIVYDPNVATDPVSRHMTKEVISVTVDERASKVADVFILHRIRRVLVQKDGKLVGLISRRDLLKAARNACKSLTTNSPFAEQSAWRASHAIPEISDSTLTASIGIVGAPSLAESPAAIVSE